MVKVAFDSYIAKHLHTNLVYKLDVISSRRMIYIKRKILKGHPVVLINHEQWLASWSFHLGNENSTLLRKWKKKTQCGVSQHNYNQLVGRYSVIESPFDSKMCLLAYTKGKVLVRETRIAIRPLPCISFFLSFWEYDFMSTPTWLGCLFWWNVCCIEALQLSIVKRKIKVITAENQKQRKNYQEQISTKLKQANSPKCGNTRTTKSRLVIVLHLIGWEGINSFLDQ